MYKGIIITLRYKHSKKSKLKSFVTIYMLDSSRLTLFLKLLSNLLFLEFKQREFKMFIER